MHGFWMWQARVQFQRLLPNAFLALETGRCERPGSDPAKSKGSRRLPVRKAGHGTQHVHQLLQPVAQNDSPKCSVPNCDRPSEAFGLCGAHRARQQRYRGDLQASVPIGMMPYPERRDTEGYEVNARIVWLACVVWLQRRGLI
jgi:hypothetical protein